MHKKIFIFLFIFLIAITLVSAKQEINVESDRGLVVEPTIKDYLRTGVDHEFEIHVFNKTDGQYMTDVTCYMHLYGADGDHIYEGIDNVVSHDFDYAFDLNGTNFTTRGEYQAKFQCNKTGLGGSTEIFFYVNDYGEELSEAESHTFNMSMIFLMILWLGALIGCVKSENYIVKFALYWVCHLLFVVGTFSVWQFNMGYAIGFVGLAGVWKVLFYVGIISVLPMIFLSMAWIFYIHAFNEHMQKLLDKGNDPETAFAMTKKKKGGWFAGK